MRRTILLLGLTVAWQAGHGQVQITSLDRTGLLQWTNPIQGSATYQVGWQSAATNRWQNLATVTNRLWLLTTNSAMGTNHARLYRVAWAEGTPFALECRNAGGSLVYTGRLYLDLQATPVFGSWETFGPTAMPPLLGGNRGRVLGNPYRPGLWLSLHPGVMDAGMELHGALNGETYAGAWGWVTFAGFTTNGNFTARILRSPP